MRRIVEQLTGRSHLLLVDPVHNLRFAKEDRPFYYLTAIFDATNTAQLWCGTSDLVAYLTRQQARTLDEPLAQIRRRIFPCIDLLEGLVHGDGGGEPLVTVEQVREMFARNRLKLVPAAAHWLCALAHVPGSGALGLCQQLVEYATMLAEMRRLPAVDVTLLKEALRRGLVPSRADSILHQVDAEPALAAKVG